MSDQKNGNKNKIVAVVFGIYAAIGTSALALTLQGTIPPYLAIMAMGVASVPALVGLMFAD